MLVSCKGLTDPGAQHLFIALMQQLTRAIGPCFCIGRYAHRVLLHRPRRCRRPLPEQRCRHTAEQARQVFPPAEDVLLGHQGVADLALRAVAGISWVSPWPCGRRPAG